jgi:uncharacterized repeat protein (TIGR03803 family)
MVDAAGILYGTANIGGLVGGACGIDGCGTVYRVTPKGKETVLYSFKGGSTDGSYPDGGLIRDASGNLYGTAAVAGPGNAGIIFKLTPKGKETILHAFAGGAADGAQPEGNLIADSGGNLYGTTFAGGGTGCNENQGCGVVFRLAPDGTETILHAFAGGSSDGASPYAGLVMDGAGNLYGTTSAGGASNDGTVFEVTADGAEAILHSFAGGNDGMMPTAGLIMDAGGNLYGTTIDGGSLKGGTVFKLAANGAETVLYAFEGNSGGDGPYAGLVMDAAANLYGTTLYGGMRHVCRDYGCGVVYELTPGGVEDVLFTFEGGTTGGLPYGGLAIDSKGNLLGTTYWGGNACKGLRQPNKGCGTVFKLTIK